MFQFFFQYKCKIINIAKRFGVSGDDPDDDDDNDDDNDNDDYDDDDDADDDDNDDYNEDIDDDDDVGVAVNEYQKRRHLISRNRTNLGGIR